MKNTPSSLLVSVLKTLVAQERAITVQQIEHLEEIDRRKCYFDFGHSSLWDFMIHELGLSSGSAQRRKDAMRLTRDEPSIKEDLLDGSLTLTNAAKVQAFRRRSSKKHTVRELVDHVANLTQDDCTRKLFEIAPEAIPQERLRIVAPEARELRMVISEELHLKLERIKAFLAHAKPNVGYAELLEHLADHELRRLEKARGLERVTEPAAKPIEATTKSAATVAVASHEVRPKPMKTDTAAPSSEKHARPMPRKSLRLLAGVRVPLPAALKREVWRKTQGRCQLCASTYPLEIDHIVPLCEGGTNELENLRLLCRNHNQRPRLAPDPWEDFPEFAPVA